MKSVKNPSMVLVHCESLLPDLFEGRFPSSDYYVCVYDSSFSRRTNLRRSRRIVGKMDNVVRVIRCFCR